MKKNKLLNQLRKQINFTERGNECCKTKRKKYAEYWMLKDARYEDVDTTRGQKKTLTQEEDSSQLGRTNIER